MSTTTAPSKKKSFFEGNKVWFVLAVVSAAVVSLVSFGLLQAATATETYYVLNQDVPARAEVTPDMLEPVTARAGGTPPTALNPAELGESVFTLYALQQGDTLTESNIGSLTALTAGLPDNFVVASFTVDPSMAVAGNIRRGDYVDIMTIMQEPAITGSSSFASSVALQRVLIIDAQVSLESDSAAESSAGNPVAGATEANEPNADVANRTGAPTVYTVGLSQDDAARLAVAMQYDLFVVLSSEASVDGDVPTTTGTATSESIWGTAAPNAGAGTDNTFGRGEAVNPNDSGDTTPTEEPAPSEDDVEAPSSPEAPSTPESGETGEEVAP